MLDELSRLHEITLGLLEKVEEATLAASPDRAMLATLRWRLTQASAARLKLLEFRVYPTLNAQGSPAERAAAEAALKQGRLSRAASARHVSAWDLDRTIADWPGYCRASATIREMMSQRIAAERELLFQPLRRLALGSLEDRRSSTEDRR